MHPLMFRQVPGLLSANLQCAPKVEVLKVPITYGSRQAPVVLSYMHQFVPLQPALLLLFEPQAFEIEELTVLPFPASPPVDPVPWSAGPGLHPGA